MDKKDRLIEIIKARSYHNNGSKFTLSSGRISEFYFDMLATMMNPEGGRLVGQMICDRLADLEVDMIGGLELGAVPVTTVTSIVSGARMDNGLMQRPTPGFLVRKVPKGHGTQSLIEGLASTETLEGKKVVIVEDVTTTGESALKAAKVVKQYGAEIVMVLTVVDRVQGAKLLFTGEGIEFDSLVTTKDFVDLPTIKSIPPVKA